MLINKTIISNTSHPIMPISHFVDLLNNFDGTIEQFVETSGITYENKRAILYHLLNTKQIIDWAILCCNSVKCLLHHETTPPFYQSTFDSFLQNTSAHRLLDLETSENLEDIIHSGICRIMATQCIEGTVPLAEHFNHCTKIEQETRNLKFILEVL